jgi:multiple sugar transport system substrate-binding protein
MEKRKLNRRDFLRLSATAATGAVIAACAPTAPEIVEVVKEVPVEKEVIKEVPVEKVVEKEKIVEKVVTPTPGPRPETVALIYSDWSDDVSVRYNTTLINEFQEANPGVTVTYFPQVADWTQKLTAMMAGGVAPDVIAAFGAWFATWGQKGQLMNLDPFIDLHKDELDLDDFYEAPLSAMRALGHQVAITKYVNPNTLYFNKDMFDEAGLDYPDYDWTWDDWRDAANRLTIREGNETTQWGLQIPVPSSFGRDAGFVWGNCGEFFEKTADGQVRFLLDQPDAIEGMQFLHDLIWKDKVLALEADLGGLSMYGGGFQAEYNAMQVDGGNRLADARYHDGIGDKFGWDGTMLPEGRCGRGIRVSCDGIMMYSGTKYPDLAWQLLMTMVSPRAVELRITERKLPPGRRSAIDLFKAQRPNYNLQCIADAMEEARPDPRSHWPGGYDAWDIIRPYYEQTFILNKITVEEAMKQAVADLHEKKPWE